MEYLIALLGLAGIGLAAWDRLKHPPSQTPAYNPATSVPGPDDVFVPVGLARRLPFISRSCWGAYLVGENLDMARKLVAQPQLEDVGLYQPSLKGSNGTLSQRPYSQSSLSFKMTDATKWMELAKDPQRQVEGSRYWSIWRDLVKYGGRVKAAHGSTMGMFCWPPTSWASPAHRDLWWRHFFAWWSQNPNQQASLAVILHPDFQNLLKFLNADAGAQPGPVYCCRQHFNMQPYLQSIVGSNDPSNAYVIACILASTAGFFEGSKFKTLDSSGDKLRQKLQVVPQTFDSAAPYMAQVTAIGASTIAGMKGAGVGAGIMGAIGLVSTFFGSNKRPDGNAQALWSDEYKPVAVPRSVLGAAGGQNLLVKASDWHPLSPDAMVIASASAGATGGSALTDKLDPVQFMKQRLG